MFYTIAGSGGVQDLGLLFVGDSQWCPVVNGTWTGYTTGLARIDSGDKV